MELRHRFSGMRVLVAGDLMVDRYVTGAVERISPEAPIPVLSQREVTQMPGGAGNVMQNIVSLGGKVMAFGRVGEDASGEFLMHFFRENSIEKCHVFSEGKTTVKTRITSQHRQLLRIDDETFLPSTEEMACKIREVLPEMMDAVDAVVLSDYGKGFLTEEISQALIQGARARNIPVFADPKGDAAKKYFGATVLTPNEKEFIRLCGLSQLPEEEEIREHALKLCKENKISMMAITRSERGISLINAETGEKRDFPTAVQEVSDVTGAGDTVIATLAMAMAGGICAEESIRLANLAASIVVSKFGVAQPSLEELELALQGEAGGDPSREEILSRIHALRHEGKRIVFTNGCFDLLHAGHVKSLRQARLWGDILVVGLNSDDSVRRNKGEDRPILALEDRRAVLEALQFVDFVIPFEEDTPMQLIREVHPDILVKGKDWEGKQIVGEEFVRSYGGIVRLTDLEPGISTTAVIERIRAGRG